MEISENRRDGVRVVINDDVEGIFFAVDGFPDFCNHFIINMGGIRLSNGIEYHQSNKVKVCLFHSDGSQLSIDSVIVSSTAKKTTIKFSSLNNQQRHSLQRMLILQQACLPTDD